MNLPTDFNFNPVLDLVALLKEINWSIKTNDDMGQPTPVLIKNNLCLGDFMKYANHLIQEHDFKPNFTKGFKLKEEDDFYLTLKNKELKIQYKSFSGGDMRSPMILTYKSKQVNLLYVKLLEQIITLK